MWEKIYKKKKQFSIWPWTEVVSLVNQFFTDKKKKGASVLELGFGVGANIPFFLEEKFKYYGIEQSNFAVKFCKKKFKKIKKNLVEGDFTIISLKKKKFDLILDRGSCTHLKYKDFKNFINAIPEKLNSNGKFIFVDLFSNTTSLNNKYKLNKVKLKKMGIRNFYNRKMIKNLFKKFNILYLSENIKNIIIKNQKVKIATWSVVIEKKA